MKTTKGKKSKRGFDGPAVLWAAAAAGAGARVLALVLALVVILAGCANSDGGDDGLLHGGGDGGGNNGDTTAPVLSAGSVTAGGTTATVNFTSSKAGVYYVVVYPAATPAPESGSLFESLYSSADIKAEGSAASGSNTVGLSGLVAGTAYKAHVTVKDTAGNYSTVWTSEAFTPGYEIGDSGPAGGLICYVNLDGFRSYGVICHYLEAAPADLGDYQWGGNGTSCDATATDIGTGAANTAVLTASGHSHTHFAARTCAGYSYGGYSDWFLPSKDELALMYTNLKAQELGGFSSTYYWSSSENASNYALGQDFADGYQFNLGKNVEHSVRTVRAF